MSSRYIIIIATAYYVCCSAFFTSAQCPDSAALNITATLYTQENGLSSNMLVGFARDSVGFRYFLGIDGKWIRYDGLNFSVVQDEKNSIIHRTGFTDGSDGNYKLQIINNIIYKVEVQNESARYKWALIKDSLICIDIGKNKKSFFRLPVGIDPDPLTNFFPNGEVCWIVTPDQVYRFDLHSGKFHQIQLPPLTQYKLLNNERLIVFCRADGSPYLIWYNMILKLNPNSTSFERISTFSEHPARLSFPVIIRDRYLFVVESNTILHEIDLDLGNAHTFNLTDYTSIRNTSALKIVSLGVYQDYLLIGTSNAGLFIFNRCANSMQHFEYGKQTSDAALANSVTWLDVDVENVIWMQTDAGLIKLEVNHQRMKTFMPSSIKKGGVCNNCNNVRAVYNRDEHNLIIGTLEGIYNFNLVSGEFSNLVSPIDLQSVWKEQAISAIAGDGRGNIFIANWTNEGILLLNDKTKKLINIFPLLSHPEFSFTNYRCLYYDSHHVLWAGTDDGFLRIVNIDEFLKSNFQVKLKVSNQFAGVSSQASDDLGSSFAITEDSLGNIWIGSKNGIHVYSYKDNSVIRYRHLPDDKHSLSDNEVRSIYISDDDVWIGTNNGGLNHFDASTKSFNAFTKEDGLPNNSIYTILEDNNGFLWLGTNAGLCRFNMADHSVRNYTPRDGIQNYEFNTNAVTVLSDGRFCYGGRTGFNIFHPDSMNIVFSAPRVAITKFKIFDKEVLVTDSVLYLPHDANSLTFDYAALSYFRNNDNQYAYMMEGADKDWIKAGNRQYTSYTNLPPGSYTFKVRAANYTGTWSDEIASMKFIINPAWYNTWWFRIAIAVLMAGAIYWVYRYRLNQMMKLQAVRNRIASDLHDEIGSTLSSISLSSTIIQGKLNGTNTEVTNLLQQVSNNTDAMMEALSDIVWAINTRNDRFDNVVNRMRAFAIEILEPCNISIQFHVSEDMHDVHLDMQHRKNLYLIFKEAVNNIVKYASCKNVRIDIRREGSRTFVMIIEDDGIGFEVPSINMEEKGLSGNGIRNMRKRAEELGGEMIIQSVPGDGASLNLRFSV